MQVAYFLLSYVALPVALAAFVYLYFLGSAIARFSRATDAEAVNTYSYIRYYGWASLAKSPSGNTLSTAAQVKPKREIELAFQQIT